MDYMKKLIWLLIVSLLLIIPASATELRKGDFMLEVTEGNIAGVEHINKFGHADGMGDGTLWNGHDTTANYEGIFQAFASPVLMSIAHSGVDSSGGTGATSITVEGLDANGDKQSATQALGGAGTTAIATLTWTRVFRAYVAVAGTGNVNANDIDIQETSAGTVWARIEPAVGQTEMAVYTVPAGKTLHVTNYYFASEDSTGAQNAEIDLKQRSVDPASGSPVERVKMTIGMRLNTEIHFQHYFSPYKVFTEKTDVYIQVDINAGSMEGHGGFDGYLVDN